MICPISIVLTPSEFNTCVRMNGHTPRATTGVTVRKLVREDIPHTARVFQEAFNETQQRHYGRPLDIGPLERALGIHHSLATHSKVRLWYFVHEEEEPAKPHNLPRPLLLVS